MNFTNYLNRALNEKTESDFWISIKDDEHRKEIAKKYEKALGNKLGGKNRETGKIDAHTDKKFLGYDNVYKFIKKAKKVHIIDNMIVGFK